eukprot:4096479-Pleurochrysis_carterae.AAC.1
MLAPTPCLQLLFGVPWISVKTIRNSILFARPTLATAHQVDIFYQKTARSSWTYISQYNKAFAPFGSARSRPGLSSREPPSEKRRLIGIRIRRGCSEAVGFTPRPRITKKQSPHSLDLAGRWRSCSFALLLAVAPQLISAAPGSAAVTLRLICTAYRCRAIFCEEASGEAHGCVDEGKRVRDLKHAPDTNEKIGSSCCCFDKAASPAGKVSKRVCCDLKDSSPAVAVGLCRCERPENA